METVHIDKDRLRRGNWTNEEAANAEVVLDFVQLLMNDHDFDAVRDRYGAGAYVQHNHGIADGIDGVLETIGRLSKRFPDYSYDVKHVLVDDDTVTIHSHATLRRSQRGNPRKGFNITDRWRVVDGQLVEHWDSIQPVDLFSRFYVFISGGRVRNSNGPY